MHPNLPKSGVTRRSAIVAVASCAAGGVTRGAGVSPVAELPDVGPRFLAWQSAHPWVKTHSLPYSGEGEPLFPIGYWAD